MKRQAVQGWTASKGRYLPSAISKSERLLVVVGLSEAVVPLSASACHCVVLPEGSKRVDILTLPIESTIVETVAKRGYPRRFRRPGTGAASPPVSPVLGNEGFCTVGSWICTGGSPRSAEGSVLEVAEAVKLGIQAASSLFVSACQCVASGV